MADDTTPKPTPTPTPIPVDYVEVIGRVNPNRPMARLNPDGSGGDEYVHMLKIPLCELGDTNPVSVATELIKLCSTQEFIDTSPLRRCLMHGDMLSLAGCHWVFVTGDILIAKSIEAGIVTVRIPGSNVAIVPLSRSNYGKVPK